jgi:CMP-2-keto-3-deoxyoctulosonic acid synthetase
LVPQFAHNSAAKPSAQNQMEEIDALRAMEQGMKAAYAL